MGFKRIASGFRRINLFLAVYFFVVIVMQIIFAVILNFEPKYDVQSVYEGAIELANNGRFSEGLMQYFAWASNNFGFTFIMSLIIRVFHGFTDSYFLIFAFTNIVLVNIAIYFLYDLVRRVCGIKFARAVLIILLFYIPIYFFPSMIYTDTATLFIPILALNLFVRLRTENLDSKRSFTYYLMIGGISGLGYVIKPTAAIMFIAIFIICCVFIRKSHVYKSIAAAAAVFFIVVALFQVSYRLNVPKEIRDAHAIPYTHWVMMSLQNSGRGTWSDFAATMSFPTYAEKSEHTITEIKTRLKEMGASGFMGLLREKVGVLYSSPDLQPDGVIPFDNNEGAIKLGEMRNRNIFYLAYCNVFFYGTVILALASIFTCRRNFTAYLAVGGIHMFFLFWEVNARWLTNFLFVLIFLACLTIKSLIDEYKNYKNTNATYEIL